MKVLLRQFLGNNHSWCVVGWGIARALKFFGHEVHLFSTDGIDYLPTDLKENLIGYQDDSKKMIVGSLPRDVYDCQISYTAMKNFQNYLQYGDKNRFGIWCYEWAGKNVLPMGFAKNYKYCDFLCAPSHFAKRVFMESGVPDSAIKVIPHGIDEAQYLGNSTISLPTNKKFKILANIAQNHLRKNIPGLLEVYGKAFSNKDDVCLILKSKEKPLKNDFDVSLSECIKNFKSKFPNHAELKIFNDFVPDISALYRSVDATFSFSYCEGFLFPALESIAAGKVVVAPNWGGQVDFLDDSNALLISGKETRANPKSMYWESKNNAIWFQPSIDDAVEKLKYCYNNFERMNLEIEKNKNNVISKYGWQSIGQQFLDLCI